MSLNKENFEDFYEKPNPWAFDGTLADLTRQKILKNIFSNSKFASGIDIGCGEGFLTARMDFIESKVGVDISDTAINRASYAYPNIKFVSGDAFKTKVIDGTFDFVSCFEALYYPSSLAERKKALKNLRNYGSENATFAFSVVTIGENQYRKYFTKNEFIQLLTEMGFVIEGIYAFTLGGNRVSPLIMRVLRKLSFYVFPSIPVKIRAKQTINASDDDVYQHLFICRKQN